LTAYAYEKLKVKHYNLCLYKSLRHPCHDLSPLHVTLFLSPSTLKTMASYKFFSNCVFGLELGFFGTRYEKIEVCGVKMVSTCHHVLATFFSSRKRRFLDCFDTLQNLQFVPVLIATFRLLRICSWLRRGRLHCAKTAVFELWGGFENLEESCS
jgi:hypothetical protein